MISLNEHIKESLLSDFDDLEASMDPKKDIEQFIRNNYEIKGVLQISREPNKNGKYDVSCRGVKVVNGGITSLTNNMFEWSEISGDFNCSYCKSLKTLEGAPKKVGGDFYCSWCDSLTSLEGAPKEVGRDFVCEYCNSLKFLKGVPKIIKGVFSCSFCDSLISLKGAPEYTGGFICSFCDSLKSLKGAPEKVESGFSCVNCRALTSLEGAPKEVGKSFECFNCGKKFTKDDVKRVCNVEDNSIYV